MDDVHALRVPPTVLDERVDDTLVWRVIEPVWRIVDLDEAAEALRHQLATLMEAQEILPAVDWCYTETFKGRFGRYFANGAGSLALEAL
jgi:hypothetical protein